MGVRGRGKAWMYTRDGGPEGVKGSLVDGGYGLGLDLVGRGGVGSRYGAGSIVEHGGI